ncbi:MAG: hypothetical protein RI556_12960 [Hydrogenovibrio sp.]|uniref:hypothetical protein n=1 Tax=Hydrogenovibrio sp. TaxID=2065821 RepID=UPI002870212A|nr:hypothetical protein [Hydrogenovibrio sp.]MDR9500080.1 hypothetical protein [Hydrogenovibrio sp.]
MTATASRLRPFLFALGLFLGSLSTASVAEEPVQWQAEISEYGWDGETIPDGQQCQRFGGVMPATPEIRVRNLPRQVNMVIAEYSDRDHEPMDHGGHGRMGFTVTPNEPFLKLPKVRGHTFRMPKGAMILEPHRNPKRDKAGAYMPPCSGGKGHEYYVTLKAVYFDGKNVESFGEQVMELGKY